MNLATIRTFATAHKTELLAGGGAGVVGLALIAKHRGGAAQTDPGVASSDPAAAYDTGAAPTAAGYTGSGYGTDPSTLLAMVLTQQEANQTALQGEVQTLETQQNRILQRLGKLREPHKPAPRPPHVIHGHAHPPGHYPHPTPKPPTGKRKRPPLKVPPRPVRIFPGGSPVVRPKRPTIRGVSPR